MSSVKIFCGQSVPSYLRSLSWRLSSVGGRHRIGMFIPCKQVWFGTMRQYEIQSHFKMFIGPMQIEIWGTYLRAVLNRRCRWRNVIIYTRSKFRTTTKKKPHKIRPAAFWGLPNRWRSLQLHGLWSLGPVPKCLALHVGVKRHHTHTHTPAPTRTHTHTHAHTHAHTTHAGTHWAPQSVWTRRSSAKTPTSPGIKAWHFSTQLSHYTDWVTGLISFSAPSKNYSKCLYITLYFSVC